MSDPGVVTFFYGSYMNPDVLRGMDLTLANVEPACVSGFDITIAPIANLVRSGLDVVYGIVGSATHAELSRLYRHAEQTLGGVYLPEAVVATTREGRVMPALCYIAPALTPGVPAGEYVDRVVSAARLYGLPSWYCAKLDRCRPPAGTA